MGRLTTHVLDTAAGRPAAGLTIGLYRLDGSPARLKTVVTNADGRVDGPLLEGGDFTAGSYELVFEVADYFAGLGTQAFYETVPVRFTVHEPDQHYHVPLLIAPYGYSTYRGS